MAVYFFRDGTPHHSDFALPVNEQGWHDTPRGRLYTEWKLKQLQDNEFLRYARRHDETSLHAAKREFGDFTTEHVRLIERLENWAYADEILARYLEVINNRLALTDFEIANARTILKRFEK